jgi:hypothetical protein
MSRKYNVVIRMGSPYFDAKVNTGCAPGHPHKWVHFDLRKMHKNDLRRFHLQLVRSFREAGLKVA